MKYLILLLLLTSCEHTSPYSCKILNTETNKATLMLCDYDCEESRLKENEILICN